MLELRFHGRGGQGAVTSAELIALAAIAQGNFAQAFPSFGPERRGAPVMAFARIDDKQIRNRTAVSNPDAVVVLDPHILHIANSSDGLSKDGLQVVNTMRSADEIREEYNLKGRLITVDANHIAEQEIGRVITNTTMLGALIRATGVIERELLIDELKVRFGRLAGGNIKAFNRAYEECCVEKG